MIHPRLVFVFAMIFWLFPGAVRDASAAVVTEWVTVGDPGNAELTVTQADGTSGYGRVDYEYRIGKYEVTNSQYTEFLNAVAATDTFDLFSTSMQSSPLGGIKRADSSGNYTYSLKPNMGNKPVNFVSWYDAARYSNWLQNGQPVGLQNASTTEDGAHTFTGFETVGLRNSEARIFVPNEHEWVKAAFYQPGAVTDNGDEWWYYPTASDSFPLQAVAEVNGDVRNPGPMIVNFYQSASWNGRIYGNVTTVGSAGNSTYYGAEDMGGNVFEWTTADPNKPDPLNTGPYIVRGASFKNTAAHLRNTERSLGMTPDGNGHQHSVVSQYNGFRVASYMPVLAIVPEPGTLMLFVVGILGFAGKRRRMDVMVITLAAFSFPALTNCVTADTFGSGLNEFDIEFVTIGDPGNAPDTSGEPNPTLPGSVPYGYRIGKYEISEDMITKANAEGGLGIQADIRGPDKPATRISWLEATTFVNWLNTSTGSPAAYKFNGSNFALWLPGDQGYDPENPYRNTEAKYFLPSADEWYKAAFYDPTTGDYFNFATGSNTPPESVASGTSPNTAIYGNYPSTLTPPADITQAGGLSPYGTMAQSGSVFEFEETDFDQVNDSVSSPRAARGGAWGWLGTATGFLSKSFRSSIIPTTEVPFLGLRVASTSLIADFDFDGDINGQDLLIWQANFGLTTTLADADGDGDNDGADFLSWQSSFTGSNATVSAAVVPEPTSLLLLISCLFALPAFRTS